MTKLNEPNLFSRVLVVFFFPLNKTMLKLIDHFNIHLVATKMRTSHSWQRETEYLIGNLSGF